MALSAFIVCVPEAEPFVAGLRERFDPSARLGVPAHITLLYPFMAPERITGAELGAARQVAALMSAFDFRLAGAGRFPGCLYLVPDPAAPFVALTRALARRFPEFPPYGGRHGSAVVPHLTVAQANDVDLQTAEAGLQAAWRGSVVAACHEIVLIENSSGRWRPLANFALAPAHAAHGAAPAS